MRPDPFTTLNAMQLWDFSVILFSDQNDVLTIRGSNDFDYYHNAEIRFIKVSLVDCPIHFSHAHFRTATEIERTVVSQHAGYSANQGTLYCIESQAGSDDHKFHFIAAARVEVDIATVKYRLPQP
jgi:hypothetical protein